MPENRSIGDEHPGDHLRHASQRRDPPLPVALPRIGAKGASRAALVCRPRAWIGEQAPAYGIQVIRSDLHRWPFDELRRISRFVRQEKIDVIHTHTSRSNFFGILGPLADGRAERGDSP